MKKASIISILIIAIGLKVAAQNQEFDSLSNKKTTAYPKYEIGFSVGVFTIMGLIIPPNDGWGGLESRPIIRHAYYMEYEDGQYEKMYNLGSYTFNYNYHFNPKHSMGISLSWIGKHIDTYEIYVTDYDLWHGVVISADTINGSGWKHYFTLQGNYRYTYYRKNKISLYCGIYGGITLCIRDKDILPKETVYGFLGSISNDRHYFAPAFQFNTFGLEIGEKYVFNMELGIGTQGFIKTGFKYKF